MGNCGCGNLYQQSYFCRSIRFETTYPIICVACVDNSGDLPGAQSFLILKQQEPAGCISDNTIRLRSQKCTKA